MQVWSFPKKSVFGKASLKNILSEQIKQKSEFNEQFKSSTKIIQQHLKYTPNDIMINQ